MIRRFQALYYRLRRGPHGQAVLATAALTGGVSVALLTGLFEPRLWPAAVSLAALAILGVLTLQMVLTDRLRATVDDVSHAAAFEQGLRRAGFDVRDFFMDGAAATPSLQLQNLKILLFCRPRNILELGSGQTTKVLSAYARATPEARVITLEQNESWARQLLPQVVHDYRHVPVEPRRFTCRGIDLTLSTTWYREVPELRSVRFDYVLVDGPDAGTGSSSPAYSRCGVLEYMPELLADSFVVVFDDADRQGEHMTAEALGRILTACGVRHVSFTIHGVKDQIVVCSPDRAFLRSV